MLHIVGSVSSCFSQEATSFTINSQPVSCDGEFQSILKDDFGSGTAEYGPQPAASNFTTTYSYTASGAVSPDRYGLLKNAFLGNICWSSDGDHTTGKSGDGYMLVFDANSVLGSVFYEKNYSGLCEGNVCNFSIYATNLTPTSYPVFSVKPMVKIDLINPLNGQILKSMVSSQLQLSESNALLWNELSLTFTIPAGLSAVKLRVSNAQTDTNGSGNDIAFDDVSFSICVPSLTFSLANEKICAGESNTIKASINNPAVPYHYQWQQSNGTTWTDIAGEISAEYKTPLLNKNTKYRIRYAQIGTDITNNNNLNCSGNKEIELQVTPRAKAADIELQSNFPICEGSQITLTPSSHAGTNFYWYDGSGSSATLLSSNSTYETGILTSSKTFYVAVSGDNYCENKPEDRKAVTVTVTPKPADIVTT
ncbi:immunoglobulin domain-containing protein, partial [Flavobacterium chryseum]|uniref:immunoglobulin domain-containing protein n=1 Tax=Flavobacterium sp. P3160 TaxID=2512113 RepID=UPI0014151432